ncbi:SurA N-terminal domain-containing protein [Halobacillus massiliensis]|uniref:SurA N-terminal domain-containing protein n=1 Tax=Halobacillus massiliensis TaxID=1926286 RepID=UPI001FE68A70|nr:SurA N-terminal domain-containing protein [Halobacillus massiliensis]
MNKKWLVSLLLAALVALLAACNNDEESSKESKEKEQAKQEESAQGGEQQELPEPDLEGIPDVVAEVNGEKIDKNEFTETYEPQFQQMAMQMQMTGQEVNQDEIKKQVAESLVGQELLIQEANNKGYEASEEEKQKSLEELAKMNQMESPDDFLAALKEQGMEEKEVMAQIEKQVKVDQLVAEEAGDTEPSEEEMKEMYEQMKAQQEKAASESEGKGEGAGEVPSYEEAKPQIEQQLKNQKEGEAVQKMVKDLREKGDVEVHI